MDLSNVRETIDRIDDEIVRLFVQRMDAVSEVAARKHAEGAPVRDRAREREIVNRMTKAAGDVYAPYVRALYAMVRNRAPVNKKRSLRQKPPRP